jgi:hypothetical protein
MDVYVRLIQAMLESLDNDDDVEMMRPVLRRQNAVYIEPSSHTVIKDYIKNTWE